MSNLVSFIFALYRQSVSLTGNLMNLRYAMTLSLYLLSVVYCNIVSVNILVLGLSGI